MLQPNLQEREALYALWQEGRGVLAQYMIRAREQARDDMENTEGKQRDEASGEAKALKVILMAMSRSDEARQIKRPDKV